MVEDPICGVQASAFLGVMVCGMENGVSSFCVGVCCEVDSAVFYEVLQDFEAAACRGQHDDIVSTVIAV